MHHYDPESIAMASITSGNGRLTAEGGLIVMSL